MNRSSTTTIILASALLFVSACGVIRTNAPLFGNSLAPGGATTLSPNNGVVSTRLGAAAWTDGVGTAARFNGPNGLVVDAGGNVYVADAGNYTIRKITPAGVVSTLAGSPGVVGYQDGTGSSALFASPTGLAIDRSGTATDGTIYVLDNSAGAIRRITSAGVVTTFVTGMTNAMSIAVDSSGNVFAAFPLEIKKITPAGVVSSFAGGTSGALTDGTGAAAVFVSLRGLTIDSADNLYAGESTAFVIRKITPGAVVTTIAGSLYTPSTVDGTGGSAQFADVTDLQYDSFSDTILVAEKGAAVVRRMTTTGTVTTILGTPAVLGRNSSRRYKIRRHRWARSHEALETKPRRRFRPWYQIRKSTAGLVVTTVAGIAPYANGALAIAGSKQPGYLVADASGNIYFTDTSPQVRKISVGGVVSTIAGSETVFGGADGTGATASFFAPKGIVLDSLGNIFVADATGATIRKITPAGVVTTFAGSYNVTGWADGTGTAARFSSPEGLAIDSNDNLYVADRTNRTIRMINSSGVVTTLAGTHGSSGSTDATGAAARFSSPTGLVFYAGNLYVTDTNNNRIRKITSAGVVTTLAGQAVPGTTDGVGTAAKFSSPVGLAFDGAGYLYVSDKGNQLIRRIDLTTATVSTFAGAGGAAGFADGLSGAARFNNPMGMCSDLNGDLYVADMLNNMIRKIH